MKRAVILHAFEQTSKSHWYPWLKGQLEERGYEVWAPDMPNNSHPNARETTDFLLANKNWNFKNDLMIGHSWGAVQILHLLQNLPDDRKVKSAVLVSAYTSDIVDKFEWAKLLSELFEEPFEFDKITSAASKIVFVHGDDDPYCDPEQACWLAEQLNSEYISIKGGKHFSTSSDPAYYEFPKLIEILNARRLL